MASARESSREVARLGRAVQKHAAKSARYHESTKVHRAIVRGLTPLVVELGGAGLTLDSATLLLTNSVRIYDRDHGLRLGDTVLVLDSGEDDMVVFDVVSDEEFAGPDLSAIVDASDPTYSGPDPQGGTQTVTASHHISKKIPVKNDAGTVIGYLPVFTSLPA